MEVSDIRGVCSDSQDFVHELLLGAHTEAQGQVGDREPPLVVQMLGSKATATMKKG